MNIADKRMGYPDNTSNLEEELYTDYNSPLCCGPEGEKPTYVKCKTTDDKY